MCCLGQKHLKFDSEGFKFGWHFTGVNFTALLVRPFEQKLSSVCWRYSVLQTSVRIINLGPVSNEKGEEGVCWDQRDTSSCMESQSGASAGHSVLWHAICPLAALSEHCCGAAKIKQKPSTRQLACCVCRLQQSPSERCTERARVPLSQARHTPCRQKQVLWLSFTASFIAGTIQFHTVLPPFCFLVPGSSFFLSFYFFL